MSIIDFLSVLELRIDHPDVSTLTKAIESDRRLVLSIPSDHSMDVDRIFVS